MESRRLCSLRGREPAPPPRREPLAMPPPTRSIWRSSRFSFFCNSFRCRSSLPNSDILPSRTRWSWAMVRLVPVLGVGPQQYPVQVAGAAQTGTAAAGRTNARGMTRCRKPGGARAAQRRAGSVVGGCSAELVRRLEERGVRFAA